MDLSQIKKETILNFWIAHFVEGLLLNGELGSYLAGG